MSAHRRLQCGSLGGGGSRRLALRHRLGTLQTPFGGRLRLLATLLLRGHHRLAELCAKLIPHRLPRRSHRLLYRLLDSGGTLLGGLRRCHLPLRGRDGPLVRSGRLHRRRKLRCCRLTPRRRRRLTRLARSLVSRPLPRDHTPVGLRVFPRLQVGCGHQFGQLRQPRLQLGLALRRRRRRRCRRRLRSSSRRVRHRLGRRRRRARRLCRLEAPLQLLPRQ